MTRTQARMARAGLGLSAKVVSYSLEISNERLSMYEHNKRGTRGGLDQMLKAFYEAKGARFHADGVTVSIGEAA